MDTTQAGQPGRAEFAAFLALDWADQKHVWKLYVPESGAFETGELDHRPESIEAWAAGLARRLGGRPIAVALEQSRGALFYMLTKYAHFVIHPVHPASLASYRKSFSPSGAKDDDRDVDLLLDLLLKHRQRLRPVKTETADTRLLALLNEQRRHLVNQKTAQLNRLTANLKLYFPQILEWFSQLDAPLVADLLRRWPTLPELKTARQATLRRFFYQHNCRSDERIEERLRQIAQGVPATTDSAIVECGTLLTTTLLAQIAILSQAVGKLERRIAALFTQHPDAFIFDSLPGAGPALAPRLLTAMGTDRDRFARANDVGSYSGIAPVRKQSGKTCIVAFRRACPKFVRQSFHEWANCSLRTCDWAGAHYQRQRDKGKGHHAAIRSLALKWIRIVYRCWKDRTPYDPERYRRALERRHAPKINPAAAALWKTEAGFSTLAQFSP
jgi:transposase